MGPQYSVERIEKRELARHPVDRLEVAHLERLIELVRGLLLRLRRALNHKRGVLLLLRPRAGE